MTDIILKRGTGVPSDTDLEVAEVAIDSSSGAMYTKLADGSVKQLNEGGASDWESITGKPTEFPPASHDHDGVYQPVGDYIGEAPTDGGEYVRQNSGWAKLENHNYTGADAVKLTGDQSVAGHKTWTGVATFGDTVTMRGTLNGDDTANFQNAVTAGSFVKSGGTSSEYLMADGSVSSGPAGGGDSIADGNSAGEITTWSGTEWTPDSSLTIDASGNATFSGELTVQGARINFSDDWQIRDGSGSFVIRNTTNSISALTIDASGNVGIGANSPLTLLHAKKTGGTTAGLFETTGDVSKVYFRDSKSTQDFPVAIGSDADSFVITTDNNKPSLTIDPSGNATVAGNVIANGTRIRSQGRINAEGYGGVKFDASGIIPADGDGNLSDGTYDLGSAARKFKDGFFGGGVNADTLTTRRLTVADTSVARIDLDDTSNATAGKKFIRSNQGELQVVNHAYSKTIVKISDDGNIDAAGFTVNGVPIGGGASGNFVDKDTTTAQTIKSTLTAPDFIATSDERLKGDITPMPIGLIDDIKPVSWTWKDGGTKSAGVVAQQLQEIGLDDYVHTNEDGQLGVNYQALTAILLAEVIDLKRRLADS